MLADTGILRNINILFQLNYSVIVMQYRLQIAPSGVGGA